MLVSRENLRTILVSTASAALLLFLVSCAPSEPTGLAGVASAFAVKSQAEKVIDRINQIRSSFDGDIKTSLDNGTAGLSQAIADLDRVAGENIKAPIEQLNLEAQQLTVALDNATRRLDALADKVNKDALGNIMVLAASAEATALEFKQFPFVPKGSPRIYYFQFDADIPNVVPENGGRAEIVGWRLNANGPPVVELRDKTRSVLLASLQPGAGKNDNSVSVLLPVELVKKHAGEALQLRVLLDSKDKAKAFERYVPLVIPASVALSARTVAHIHYNMERNVRSPFGEERIIEIRNGSCENERQVNELLVWDVPADASITQPLIRTINVYRAERVQARKVGRDRISVSGTVSKAKCHKVLVGQKLDKPSWYHVGIRPQIEKKVIRAASGTGEKADSIESGKAAINVDVPVTIGPSEKLTGSFGFDYQVQFVLNGAPYGKPFQAPRQEVGNAGGDAKLGDHQGFAITASCNPRVVNGKAQVAVQLKRK